MATETASGAKAELPRRRAGYFAAITSTGRLAAPASRACRGACGLRRRFGRRCSKQASLRHNHTDRDRTKTLEAPSTETGIETLEAFEGELIALQYPSDWSVETAEVWKGSGTDGYYDTTLRSDADPNVMVRIDVTHGSFAAPEMKAAEVEQYLVRQAGYRRLAFSPTSFAGYEAFRWDFAAIEHGIPLLKSDIFFKWLGRYGGYRVF